MAQNETEDSLNPAQLAVLNLLVAGQTITAASQAVGVGRTTVYRWLGSTDFAVEYNRRRKELLESHQNRLILAAGKAVDAVAN